MNLLAEFAQYWTTHLWPASLQVAIFISLVYAISICCFRRFPARYRYILWLLVLARLAIPTSVTSPLGIGQYPERFFAKGIQWISEQKSPAPPQLPIAQETIFENQPRRFDATGASLGNPAAYPPVADSMNNSVPILCIIWLSGVLVLVLAIIARILLFCRRIRGLHPVTRTDLLAALHRLRDRLSIKRTVKLLKASGSDNIQYPSVHGIIKSTIILPADMVAGWTTDALEPLLLHELTHVKRRDCLVNFAQIVLQVLYFYHPMVWFANWIIRREREFACDDDVVRHSSGCPTAYARSMLRIAETAVNQRRHQLFGIAMADSFSNLGRRIRRMMSKGYRVNQQAGFIYLAVIFLLGIFGVAVSAQGPDRPAAAEQSKSAENLRTPSGSLESAPEDRLQTESADASRRLAAEDPALPMPQQASGQDPIMVGLNDAAAQALEKAPSEWARIDPSADEPKIIASEEKEEPYSIEEYTAYINATNESDYEKRATLLIEFMDNYSKSQLIPYVESAYKQLLFDSHQEKKYEQLEHLAEKWLEFYPNELSAMAYIVAASEQLGDDQKSVAYLEKIYEAKPSKSYAESIARLYQKMGNEAKYTEWLRKIEADFGLRLLPKQQFISAVPPDHILFETGSEYLEKSEYLKARLAFQTLISTYPESDFAAYSYIKVGDAFYDEGGAENMLKAADRYKEFIALFPTYSQAADIQMKVISIYMDQMPVSGFSGTILWADEEIDRFLKLYPDNDSISIVRQYRDYVSQVLADQRLSKITGSLAGPAGIEITGVAISLIDKETGEVLQTAYPDNQGHFVIRGVPQDRKIGLQFSKNGLAPYFYDGTDPYSAPIIITMHPALIERIDIRGNRRVPDSTIRRYIQTKPGQLYSQTQLDSDIVAVYRSNYFDYVEIEERDGDTGKIITFIVEEKLLIRSIEFSGNISFTESDILDAFQKNKVELIVDRQYEQRNMRVAERVLKDLMAQHGKPRGTVRTETEIIFPGAIRLRFVIDEEGPTPR